jgi:hypothetical protein
MRRASHGIDKEWNIITGNPEEKRQLERPRRRWKDNN